MPGEDQSLLKLDKASEGERNSETSAKVAGEAVTDDAQAPRYQPTFTSFSSSNDKVSLDDSDPLKQVMDGNAQRRGEHIVPSVSEFALEDKQAGKVITARGERSLSEPRQSWMDGLKKVIDDAKSPVEFAQCQGKLCIDYIERKAQEALRAVRNLFALPQSTGGGEYAQNSRQTEQSALGSDLLDVGCSAPVPFRAESGGRTSKEEEPLVQFPILEAPPTADSGTAYGDSEPTLIALNPDVKSKTEPQALASDSTEEILDSFARAIGLEKISRPLRPVNQDDSGLNKGGLATFLGIRLLTNAPADILSIGYEGDRGKPLAPKSYATPTEFFKDSSHWSDRTPNIDDWARKIQEWQTVTSFPRLAELRGCYGGDPAKGSDDPRTSLAAQVARKSGSYVMASVGGVNGNTGLSTDGALDGPGKPGLRRAVLFAPDGCPVRYYNTPLTDADWTNARFYATRTSPGARNHEQ
jgi:hypothetical protein